MTSIPLTQALARDFGQTIRQRGDGYFRGGRVRIESGSAVQVAATVRGTGSYRVELSREGDEIQASCSCPYFEDALCKHVWAVVMAAEERRLLEGDGRNEHLFMTHAEGFDEEEDGSNDFANRVSSPATVNRRQTTASWRTQLARLNALPTAPATREEWPAGRELLYVFDVAGNRAVQALALEIMVRDRKQNGDWSKPKSRRLARALLNRLPDADDRHILSFLGGAGELYGYDLGYGAYDYYDSLPFRFRLRDPQPALIMPMLCRTGRCRLRLRPQDPEPEWLTLAWDEGAPWQPQ